MLGEKCRLNSKEDLKEEIKLNYRTLKGVYMHKKFFKFVCIFLYTKRPLNTTLKILNIILHMKHLYMLSSSSEKK